VIGRLGKKTSLLVHDVEQELDPLAHISTYFRDEQLQKALSILLLPGQSTGTVQDALDKIEMAEENNKAIPNGKLILYQDPVSYWWSSVLSASSHWMLSQTSQASDYYQEIYSVPHFPQETQVTIGKALVSTFESAKIQSDFNVTTEEYHQIVDVATADLDAAARCLKFSGEDDIQWTEEELILKNCLLLSCDWQLNARTKFWQSNLNGGPVTSNYLQSFQHDLNSLKRVSESLTWARPRVYLHEATLRMMAGAAPNRTQQLLDRSLIQKSSSRGLICGKDVRMVLTGEREHAVALYMACRHLPSQLLCSPGERAGMLAEAAKTLKKIGDQRSLEECNILMKTLGISIQL